MFFTRHINQNLMPITAAIVFMAQMFVNNLDARISFAEIKGLGGIFKDEYQQLNPLWGALLWESKYVENIYRFDYKQLRPGKTIFEHPENLVPGAVCLTHNLFFFQHDGVTFTPTGNPSYPAFYLDVEKIGQVIALLEIYKIPEKRESLKNLLKKIFEPLFIQSNKTEAPKSTTDITTIQVQLIAAQKGLKNIPELKTEDKEKLIELQKELKKAIDENKKAHEESQKVELKTRIKNLQGQITELSKPEEDRKALLSTIKKLEKQEISLQQQQVFDIQLIGKTEEHLSPDVQKDNDAFVGKVISRYNDSLRQLQPSDPKCKELTDQIKAQEALHKDLVGQAKKMRKNIDTLTDCLCAAIDEEEKNIYPKNHTIAIMLALLWTKAETKEDFLSFTKAFIDTYDTATAEKNVIKILKNSSILEKNSKQRVDFIKDTYTKEDYETMFDAANVEPDINNIEKLSFLFLGYRLYKDTLPPKIAMKNSVKYKGYMFPDCGETTLLNLFNVLLYDSEKAKFDISLLIKISNNQNLIKFYTDHQNSSSMADNDELHGKWAEVVSALPGVIYGNIGCDIDSGLNNKGINNMLKVINNLVPGADSFEKLKDILTQQNIDLVIEGPTNKAEEQVITLKITKPNKSDVIELNWIFQPKHFEIKFSDKEISYSQAYLKAIEQELNESSSMLHTTIAGVLDISLPDNLEWPTLVSYVTYLKRYHFFLQPITPKKIVESFDTIIGLFDTTQQPQVVENLYAGIFTSSDNKQKAFFEKIIENPHGNTFFEHIREKLVNNSKTIFCVLAFDDEKISQGWKEQAKKLFETIQPSDELEGHITDLLKLLDKQIINEEEKDKEIKDNILKLVDGIFNTLKDNDGLLDASKNIINSSYISKNTSHFCEDLKNKVITQIIQTVKENIGSTDPYKQQDALELWSILINKASDKIKEKPEYFDLAIEVANNCMKSSDIWTQKNALKLWSTLVNEASDKIKEKSEYFDQAIDAANKGMQSSDIWTQQDALELWSILINKASDKIKEKSEYFDQAIDAANKGMQSSDTNTQYYALELWSILKNSALELWSILINKASDKIKEKSEYFTQAIDAANKGMQSSDTNTQYYALELWNLLITNTLDKIKDKPEYIDQAIYAAHKGMQSYNIQYSALELWSILINKASDKIKEKSEYFTQAIDAAIIGIESTYSLTHSSALKLWSILISQEKGIDQAIEAAKNLIKSSCTKKNAWSLLKYIGLKETDEETDKKLLNQKTALSLWNILIDKAWDTIKKNPKDLEAAKAAGEKDPDLKKIIEAKIAEDVKYGTKKKR